jgi:hypothetical protein
VRDDPRDGVAAAVVLAEDLAEEAPDGGDGAEQAVAVLDGVLVEGPEDAAFAQSVGEGESLVAPEASANLLQGSHGWTSDVFSENGGGPGGAG